MKKANRSSKIINFKDFNTGYNAVSEREDNIIGQKLQISVRQINESDRSAYTA